MAFCPIDNGHFCFRHRTSWHRDFTCEQYDAFLADPQSFNRKVRTRGELDETSKPVNHTSRSRSERLLAERKAREAAERKRRQEIQQHKDRLIAEEVATASVIKHCPRCNVEIEKDGGW
ncbi:hypothetical protein F5Y00DRAFT_261648 [Daldinia vernicosa]|uniref:uncharacterized protein n=1 Tax=Daldinia vernicosa TaxID=114800 RepID=UPI00200837EF|nr:uncharacterized protein F5Y00DRAFT_261648 [Daldinia vernicosa]KAI0849517.1 hypothetical protein F5Y00DRAFT_261648 [Daldinia vernicosa]